MGLIVQKFGGWAVASRERVEQSAQIVADTVAQGHQVVVVVSAMGSQTSELLGLAHQYHDTPSPRELDVLLSSGERMTMALFSMALHALGVNAVSLTGSQSGILTDHVHGHARIEDIRAFRVTEALSDDKVVVVAGFQGVCPQSKDITTLGRSGSDLTAIALAVALNADACRLYKGVAGMMTANPKEYPNARTIESLSWDEACSFAWAGAGVLHHRGAELGKANQVSIELCSLVDGGKVVTKIEGEGVMESARVVGVTEVKDQVIYKIQHPELNQKWNLLITELWQQGYSPLIAQMEWQNSQWVAKISVPLNLAKEWSQTLQNHQIIELNQQACCILSVVGSGLRADSQIVSQTISCIEDSCLYFEIQDHLIRIASDQKFSSQILSKLHKMFCIEK